MHGGEAASLPDLLRRRRALGRVTSNELHSCVYPNHTLYNVETPDCLFRRFTPDGKHLIAFSRTLNGLQAFHVLGGSTSVQQIETDSVAHKSEFWRFFQPAWTQTLAGFGEALHRDLCLVTSDGRHIIVARLRRADGGTTTQRPNTLGCLRATEDIALLVVDVRTGMLCDTREYASDIVYLSGHNGVSLLDDRLCVVSLKYQCLRLLRICRDGRLVDEQEIGWYTRDDDAVCEDMLRIREEHALAERAAQRRAQRAATETFGCCLDDADMPPAAKRRRAALAQAARTEIHHATQSQGEHASRSARMLLATGVRPPFIYPFSAQARQLQGPLPPPPQPGTSQGDIQDSMSLHALQRLAPHYRTLFARAMQPAAARGDVLGDGDVALVEPSLTTAPHGALKQRLLGALFERARNADDGGHALRHFHRTYRQYEGLVLWRAQFIGRTQLLLRFVPLHVATSRAHAARAAASSSALAGAFSLLAEYDVAETRFGRIWDSADAALGREIAYRVDVYRVPMASGSLGAQAPSISNDVHLRDAFDASQLALRAARSGGPVQAARKAAMLLPFAPQSIQESPLLDPARFRCNLRVRQCLEKLRAAAAAPIRFYARRSGALRFVLAPAPGPLAPPALPSGAVLVASGAGDAALHADAPPGSAGSPKPGAVYLLHPLLPLVLSTRTDTGTGPPVTNIHFRGGI